MDFIAFIAFYSYFLIFHFKCKLHLTNLLLPSFLTSVFQILAKTLFSIGMILSEFLHLSKNGRLTTLIL